MSVGGGSGGKQESAEARELYRIQGQIAREQWDEHKRLGSPVLENLAADAQAGPSAARYKERIGAAGADVSHAFGREREMQRREMGRYGLNPSSGRFVGTDRAMGISEAGATAGAMTRARRGVDDEDYARKINLVGITTGQGAQAQQGLSSAAGGLSGIANQKANAKANQQAGIGQLVGTGITAGVLF